MVRLLDAAEAEAKRTEANRTEAEKKRLENPEVDGADELDRSEDGEDGLGKAGNQAVSELSILDLVPEGERIYVQFALAISTAEARCELRLLRKISKGGRDWKANMTILERRFSESWSKEVKTTHTIEGNEEKPVVVTYESDEQRAMRVASILAKANAIEGNGRPVVIDDQDDARALPGKSESKGR